MNIMSRNYSLRSARKQQGFSMAEALIAMAVTAFGLMAVGKFQSVTLIASGQSKARTEALALAEREIEQLRNYESLAVFDGQIVSDASQWGGQNAEYTITRTVTMNASPAYKNLTVTVSWEDRTGPQEVELTSFINRGDPLNASKVMIASVGGLDYFSTDSGPDDDESIEETGSEFVDEGGEQMDFTDVSDNNDGTDVGSDDGVNPDTQNSNTYSVTISGSIKRVGNGINVLQVSASGNYPLDCVHTDSFYTCESGPIPNGVDWAGSVSIKSNRTVCYNESVLYYSMVDSNISHSYTIAKNQNSCP